VTIVQRHREDQLKAKRTAEAESISRGVEGDKEKLPDITLAASERAAFVPEYDEDSIDDTSTVPLDEKDGEVDERDLGSEHILACSPFSG
jgi:vacuole morphology and inheritance protein 14